jgi:hypothetical protein
MLALTQQQGPGKSTMAKVKQAAGWLIGRWKAVERIGAAKVQELAGMLSG